jgi:hypothetical protein
MADPACAREFLSRGADPDHIGPSGKSILVGAIVSSEDTSWIEVLLEYSARLEQEDLFYALRPRVRQNCRELLFCWRRGSILTKLMLNGALLYTMLLSVVPRALSEYS